MFRLNISRILWWAGYVSEMENGKKAFKMLTGNPTGKRPLGRSTYGWEDNIRMDFKEIGVDTRNWID